MNSFDVFSKMSTTIDRELFSTCHKDHKCKYCGNSFTTASHLKNHKAIAITTVSVVVNHFLRLKP